MTKTQKSDFLKFLLRKNIPLHQAMEIVEDTDKKLKDEKNRKEKAVALPYEKR